MNYNQEYYDKVYPSHLDYTPYQEKLSTYYMHNIFSHYGIDVEGKKMLDYGSGPGHLTLANKAECYDISDFITNFLKDNGRVTYENGNSIPSDTFDIVLSSHSLEHAIKPIEELETIHRCLKENGIIGLVLPFETLGQPVKSQDIHKHFYTWNFQTIANLLIEANFEIIEQDIIYAPAGLKHLKNLSLIRRIGRFKKVFPSILTLARKKSV